MLSTVILTGKITLMYKFTELEFGLQNLIGISNKTLEEHFALYKGYIDNANTLLEQIDLLSAEGLAKPKNPQYTSMVRRLGWEINGIKLHELYFGNLTQHATGQPGVNLSSQLVSGWGSFANWQKEFTNFGLMRGPGWVILAQDNRSNFITNFFVQEHDVGLLIEFTPVIVMDVWEHAYLIDYSTSLKAEYIRMFFTNLNWQVANSRALVR